MIAKLAASGPVPADGAWGTELQARGLAAGELPDLWNLEHPERVAEVARAYAEAGSRVVLTNTFRANRIALGGHAARCVEINREGARLSRKGAGAGVRVFGSIGPSGKLLLMEEVTEAALYEAFREQAAALAGGGADALLVETMSDLAEAAIAVRAARETKLPVIASMVFDSGKNKDRTMMGATPEQAARALAEAGAEAVGANCGSGIAGYVEICRRLKAAAGLPVWIKPNAGAPELVDGRAVYRTTPEEFAAHVPALVEAGASFIGGCCGTTPDFIRAVCAVLGKVRA
jgi:5-methyltetrahydrofolate--homocysteine methyltransferase